MERRDLKTICLINLKYNFLPHFLAAVLLALFTPVLFRVEALDGVKSAYPLEMVLSLVGMICLTPVFLPEQEEGIRDVVRVRKTGYLAVGLLRLCYSLLGVSLIFGAFVLFMYGRECDVTLRHLAGGIISAFYLGAVGFAAAGISRNVILGYLVSFLCYVPNFGGAGKGFWASFYLFSMAGGSFQEKYWLLSAGLALVLLTFLVKRRREG